MTELSVEAEEEMKRETGIRIGRWVCSCSDPPVLLGTYDSDGNVYISVRKRHYHVIGSVTATCPVCGAVHILKEEARKPPACR